jgi:CpeT protein
LMLLPAALGVAHFASLGDHTATAAPVSATVEARLAKMIQGHFEAPARGWGDQHLVPVSRKTCRVSAPELGQHVLYSEERFVTGASHPLSQRVYVVQATDNRRADIREFKPVDPASMVGLCDRATREIVSAEVEERTGCALHAQWDHNRFQARTDQATCSSVMNGADHMVREVVFSESEISIVDRGYDAAENPVWGQNAAPIRFVRKVIANP